MLGGVTHLHPSRAYGILHSERQVVTGFGIQRGQRVKTFCVRWYRKVWLLLYVLGYGACASAPNNLPPSYFSVGPTEVDVDQGRLEMIDLYHRPRIERLYTYDKTVVDLATPLPFPPKDTLSLP